MFARNLTRSIHNFLQFGVPACAIVAVAMFDPNCAIAQTSALASQNVHTISGIVRMQGTGEAVEGAKGRIVRKEDTYVVLGSTPTTNGPTPEYLFNTDSNGRWSVDNLPDGSYVVAVTPGSTDSAQKPGQRFATKKQMIVVAGTDLEGVLIEVSTGARILGTLVVEGDVPLSSLSVDAMKIDAPFEMVQSVSKSLTPTGKTTTFTLSNVPEGVIEMNAFLQTDEHYIKSITANGIDLLLEKLNLTSGMDVTDFKIVVVSDLAEFTGRIISESGKTPLPGMRISLDWTGKRRVLGGRLTRRVDEQGAFLLRPPPGEYQVHVWGEPGSARETLPLVKSLPPVTFRPGEHKNMEIRIP